MAMGPFCDAISTVPPASGIERSRGFLRELLLIEPDAPRGKGRKA
jgi:hypothetical protein